MHELLAYAAADPQLQNIMAQFQGQIPVPGPREKKISRHKFTPDEDDVLRQLVAQHGTSDWTSLAQHVPSRTPRQCRDRWKHYLSPEVVVGNWTEDDDRLLLQKVDELGTHWAAIAQLFPGRTDIGVKNRYISITGKKGKDAGDRGPQRAILLPSPAGGAQEGTHVQLPFDLPAGMTDHQGHYAVKRT
jgi:hypothetical protein